MPYAHPRGFPSPCVLVSDLLTPVVQDRLKFWHICQTILTRSGAGAPELQRWAQCLPVGETRRQKSRPGGLSYRKKSKYETPSGKVEGTSLSRYEIETGKALRRRAL